MNEPTDAELAWLVGFYEGEGNVACPLFGGHHGPRSRYLQLQFTQNERWPLEKVEVLLGKGRWYRKGKETGAWDLRYFGHEALMIMDWLQPLLSPRRQAQLAKARCLYQGRSRRGDNRRGTRNSPGQMGLL